MKKLILFFILLWSVNCKAQNWQLFPFNQLDYFASPGTSTSFNNIYEYKNDSTTIVGDTSLLYFNRFPVAEDHNNCYYTTKIMLGDTLEFDSLIEWGNNYYYLFIADTAVFPTLALPGDSVIINCANGGSNFNRVKLTCDSLKTSTVFGIADSVKYFSVHAFNGNTPVNYYNNYTYKLSKTFGLLNFIPFRYWLYHPSGITFPTYAIKGLINSTQTLGFHLPTFENYMHHYSVGDIYKWAWGNGVFNQFSESGFFRDSILNVQYLTDEVIIYVNEDSVISPTYPDTSYTSYNVQVLKHFFKKDYNDEIDKTYSQVGYANAFGGIGPYLAVYQRNLLSIDSCMDTTFTCNTNFFMDNCQLDTFEFQNSFSFSTAAGLTATSYIVSDAGANEELIGFKTATTSCGDYSQITGIPQLLINNNQVTIFPNPFSQQATLQFSQPIINNSQLTLFDLTGRQVENYSISDGTNNLIIKRNNLPAGMYFYKLSGMPMLTGKIVIE